MSAGEEEGAAYGGHLIEGCTVFSLAEIAIAELEGVTMTREYDEATKGPQLFAKSSSL